MDNSTFPCELRDTVVVFDFDDTLYSHKLKQFNVSPEYINYLKKYAIVVLWSFGTWNHIKQYISGEKWKFDYIFTRESINTKIKDFDTLQKIIKLPIRRYILIDDLCENFDGKGYYYNPLTNQGCWEHVLELVTNG